MNGCVVIDLTQNHSEQYSKVIITLTYSNNIIKVTIITIIIIETLMV